MSRVEIGLVELLGLAHVVGGLTDLSLVHMSRTHLILVEVLTVVEVVVFVVLVVVSAPPEAPPVVVPSPESSRAAASSEETAPVSPETVA